MKRKNMPMRRCAGCMESKPQKELIRIAFYEGSLTVDTAGNAKGRGVYLCREMACVEKAEKKRAFQRSFRTDLRNVPLDQIFEEIKGEIIHGEK